MYLLFLDESGTHGGSPVFVLGGLAVHEHDAWFFQQRLEAMLSRHLTPLGLNSQAFELHAAEIMSPTRQSAKKGMSPWAALSVTERLRILGSAYHSISTYHWVDPRFPVGLFGAVVDGARQDREVRAYELVLQKFDSMLHRVRDKTGESQRGLVIHDRRVIERTVQEWTATWRVAANRVGRLQNLADVPLFADSKASRLLQAADFVSWGFGDTTVCPIATRGG